MSQSRNLKEELAVGLGILSGRLNAVSISINELSTLGYDPDGPHFRRPDDFNLRRAGEQAVMNVFERLMEHVKMDHWT